MVVAAPSMVPTAAAAGALYVSAENAQFDNLFGGPMVIEVIVKDPNRSMTNENAGEPTVMVDNQKLKMAQALDGNWYGYFADKTDVAILASVTADQLNWGTTSTQPSYGGGNGGPTLIGNVTTTYHNGTAAEFNFAGVIDNPPALSNWNSTNASSCTACGQIGMNSTMWPMLQAFDFTQGDFDIVLEQAGTDEVVTLDHNNADLDDYSGLTLDRNSATQGAEIHMFIVDQQLNIDPTDEDKVIFKIPANGTTGEASVAWTNGTFNWSLVDAVGLGPINATGYSAAGIGHGFSDNGKLLINNDTTSSGTSVITKSATADDEVLGGTTGSDYGIIYLVFVEDADNTGTFSNVDDNDESNLEVESAAKRGTTATFDYNDSAQSFIVSNDFGTLDMVESSVGDEWNSGETLTVTLVDQDLNKNTLSDEDMTLAAHNSTIPSLMVGSPITLTSSTTASGVRESSEFGNANMTVGAFNKIGTITTVDASTYAGGATLNYTTITVAEYRAAADAADYIYLNYDVTSVLTNTITGIELWDSSYTELLSNEYVGSNSGLLLLDNTITATGGSVVEADLLLVNFTGDGIISAAVGETLYVDIFTFGDVTGQDRANNAIYRFLLEESGDNTATFVGDVEFVMLNQINSDTSTVFSAITTISDSIDIIVH